MTVVRGTIVQNADQSLVFIARHCPICTKPHELPLLPLEQKFAMGGDHFLYWCRCPISKHLILLDSAVGGTISAALIRDPSVKVGFGNRGATDSQS